MHDAKEKIEAWRIDYNVSRSHQALQDLTPTEFAERARVLRSSMDHNSRKTNAAGGPKFDWQFNYNNTYYVRQHDIEDNLYRGDHLPRPGLRL